MDVEYIVDEALKRSTDLKNVLAPLIDEFILNDIKVKHCKFKGMDMDGDFTTHLQKCQDISMMAVQAVLQTYKNESEYDFK